MGEQRISEVNMLALIFLLLSVVILLAAAGRIWIDATPLDSRGTDSAVADSPGEAATLKKISADRNSVA